MKYSIKVTVFLLLAGITTFFLQREQTASSALNSFNQGYLDWLAGNAAGKIEEPAVTFVRVDSDELNKDDMDPRLDWAVILEGLNAYQPKAVGIVPPLQWDTKDSLAEGALRKWVNKMPKMVLGTTFASTAPENLTPIPVESQPVIANVTGDTSQLPEAKHLVAAPDDELLINGKPAFTQIELAETTESGPNGVPLPMLARVGDKVVASFTLEMILAYEGLDTSAVTVDLDAQRIQVGEKYIFPIDAQGNLTVYHGMKGAFPEMDIFSLALSLKPFDNVPELQAQVDQFREVDDETLESLKNHAIVVGFDQEALRQFELPTGDKVSRSELLAMAIATIQSGRHIKYWPSWALWASWAGLGVFGLVLLAGGRTRAFLGGFLALMLYAIVSLLSFKTSLAWAPPLPAVGICAVISLAGLLLPASGKKKDKLPEKSDKPDTQPEEAKA